MADLGDVTHGLRATSHIGTRKDFERWHARVGKRRRFLLTAYLCGALFAVSMGTIATLIHLKSGKPFESDSVWPVFFSVVFGGLCCSGPLALVAGWLLLSSGLRSYGYLFEELVKQQRICYVCGCPALFDDKFVDPVQKMGHTRDDLYPKMNVIEVDGQTHVLCDVCFANVNNPDTSHA